MIAFAVEEVDLMDTAELKSCERPPHAKYEKLIARAKEVPSPKTIVVYPCDESSLRGAIDAAALCKMADRGQITGGIVDGPLAFDNAIDPEAAEIKGIKSPVAGRAQILVVPDLEAGNMLAKNLTFLLKADAAGVVLGARVPIILTSRADSVRARMASCAVAALYAHDRRQQVALPAA